MKKVFVFPGTSESSQSIWFPYLKKELDYEVEILKYPNPDKPDVNALLKVALSMKYDSETILVGHSAGVALILATLEELRVKVAKAILVAGYVSPLKKYPDANLVLKESYIWEKIKKNVAEVITINAVNDPWGCDDIQGRYIFDKLGGSLIINNEGHMGSSSYNQPYKEFPFLLKLIQM